MIPHRNIISLVDAMIQSATVQFIQYDFDDAEEVQKFIEYFRDRTNAFIEQSQSIKEFLES
jgi:hypothetical protein